MVMINKNAQTLTEKQHNVLIGSMLGDGSLSIRKDSISPRLTIRRQLLDMPYLQWQFEVFRNLCREKSITTGATFDKRYNKEYSYCNLETRYIPAFKFYYNEWYPNKKKIIPNNLKLNSEIIAVWACDDGSFRVKNKERFGVVFHTQGFTKDEVWFLKYLLDDRYGIKFTVQNPEDQKYIIVGADHQTRILLEDIDTVFPDSMSRKSSIWRNPEANFYFNKPRQFKGQIRL